MRLQVISDLYADAPPAARGVALMLVTTLVFTAMQVTVRHVAEDMHPFQVAFFRNIFGLAVLLPFILRSGFSIFRTTRLRLHAARAVLQTTGMLLFFTALTLAPLTEVVALSFTSPLFATVLAILILREKAGVRRWAALMAGFAGALIILRPGVAVVGLGPLLVVFSSLVWGGAMTFIKVLGRTDSSLTITAYMGLFMVPLSFIPALFVWEWPGLDVVPFLLLIGIFGAVGHLALAQAFKEADTTAVMPFDFLRLIWASLLGFIVFAEVPDAWTWIGGTVIFGSATYIAFREARRRQEKPDGGVLQT